MFIVNVRKGRLTDLPELQNLFVETVTTVCAPDYNKQQIAIWTSSVENKQRWFEIISKQLVLVAHNRGQIVGFATLYNNNYIDLLYVHKNHLRQGIAQRLLNEIETEAVRLGQRVLSSDVSITAKPFFEKNGFITIEEQKNIIQPVAIINYIMIKKL